MTPEEVAALSRISPTLAPYIVVSVPTMGFLFWFFPAARRMPVVRRLCTRWLGYDPGAAQEDETSRRTMAFIDQMQEELTALRPQITQSRTLLDRYATDIDQLRLARIGMLRHMVELRDAALAARTQLHALQRQFGIAETEFASLPSETEQLTILQSPGRMV